MDELELEKGIADAYREALSNYDMKDYRKCILHVNLTEEQKKHLQYFRTDDMSFNQACEAVYRHVYC